MEMSDYRDVAFHSHQAVEKLLKAAIVYQTGQRPPYVHKLRELLSRLSDCDPPTPVVEAVLVINPHYRATRYPGVVEDLEFYVAPNARRLLEQMEQVFQWVRDRLP